MHLPHSKSLGIKKSCLLLSSSSFVQHPTHPQVTMQNDAGDVVDLYVPRKCAATNRLITAKDHASVQINVADVDEEGRMIPGQQHTYAFCGFVRREGQSDDSLNRLATQDGLLKNVFSARQ